MSSHPRHELSWHIKEEPCNLLNKKLKPDWLVYRLTATHTSLGFPFFSSIFFSFSRLDNFIFHLLLINSAKTVHCALIFLFHLTYTSNKWLTWVPKVYKFGSVIVNRSFTFLFATIIETSAWECLYIQEHSHQKIGRHKQPTFCGNAPRRRWLGTLSFGPRLLPSSLGCAQGAVSLILTLPFLIIPAFLVASNTAFSSCANSSVPLPNPQSIKSGSGWLEFQRPLLRLRVSHNASHITFTQILWNTMTQSLSGHFLKSLVFVVLSYILIEVYLK